jgi:hypothetical protein
MEKVTDKFSNLSKTNKQLCHPFLISTRANG